MSAKTELPTLEGRCETCRFWDTTESGAMTAASDADVPCGSCRRMPPVLCFDGPDNDGVEPCKSFNWQHPVTEADDWCGEWQPKQSGK